MSPESQMSVDELISNFEFLGDWEQRFHYILDLGKSLPDMPDEERVDENKVKGCQATVWLKEKVTPGSPPVLEFHADSDAFMVKGLIAILMVLFSGKNAREILDVDAESLFVELGLENHLSPTRRNGLHAMLKRIREMARQAMNGAGAS